MCRLLFTDAAVLYQYGLSSSRLYFSFVCPPPVKRHLFHFVFMLILLIIAILMHEISRLFHPLHPLSFIASLIADNYLLGTNYKLRISSYHRLIECYCFSNSIIHRQYPCDAGTLRRLFSILQGCEFGHKNICFFN